MGTPVIVTRSTADGQVLAVRTPERTVDVAHHTGAVILVVLGLVLAACCVGFAWFSRPHPVGAAVLVLVGLLFSYAAFLPQHDLGPSTLAVPDASAGYPDPPTGPPGPSGRRVGAVVPVGTVVSTRPTHRVTVTGPPEPGLPPGADPGPVAGFATVRVPLLAEPGPDAGAYGADESYLPNMVLTGEGRGVVTELWRSPRCGGAPDALPAYFAAPRRGFVCFAVPDGFVPRYLVFPQADLAVDLTGQGAATTSR